MKQIYFLLILISFFCSAQNFQWVDFPAVNNELFSSVENATTCDNAGNVYFVGIKDNKIVSGNYYGHLFYRKYNSNGTLLFEKIIGGKARIINMTSDSSGNIYLAAAYKNSVTFESGTTITTPETTEVPVVIKLDSNGAFVWSKNFIFTGTGLNFKALTTDSNDNLYFGIDNNIDEGTSIIKLSGLDGSILMIILQQYVGVLSSLSIDSLGNIYSAGSCVQNNSTFAGVVQPTIFDYNSYATKYTSSGLHQWTRYVEDATCPDPMISVKNPNSVYFSSGLGGAFAFGSLIALGFPLGQSDDIFVTKLDENGNFQWIKEIEGTGEATRANGKFLASDANGNVYCIGKTRGTTFWNTNIITTIASSEHDALLLKYDRNGNLLFAKTVGGTSSDSFEAVTLDEQGNVYVAGIASGNLNFDGITNSVGNIVPFIAKIGATLGISNFEENEVYPNPTDNHIFITNLREKNKGVIYNIVGQKVTFFETNGTNSISVIDLPKGIYFIKLENKKTIQFIKN